MCYKVFDRYNDWRVVSLEETNISTEKDQYRIMNSFYMGYNLEQMNRYWLESLEQLELMTKPNENIVLLK